MQARVLRSFVRALLTAAVLAVAAGPAVAGDYVVDAVNGADSNSGSSPGGAWRTVTDGAASVPGDARVYVARGFTIRPFLGAPRRPTRRAACTGPAELTIQE